MEDISEKLWQLIQDEKYSSLLAFITIKDGIHIPQSKPSEESCRRLRDTRDISLNGQTLGIHLHGDSDTGL